MDVENVPKDSGDDAEARNLEELEKAMEDVNKSNPDPGETHNAVESATFESKKNSLLDNKAEQEGDESSGPVIEETSSKTVDSKTMDEESEEAQSISNQEAENVQTENIPAENEASSENVEDSFVSAKDNLEELSDQLGLDTTNREDTGAMLADVDPENETATSESFNADSIENKGSEIADNENDGESAITEANVIESAPVSEQPPLEATSTDMLADEQSVSQTIDEPNETTGEPKGMEAEEDPPLGTETLENIDCEGENSVHASTNDTTEIGNSDVLSVPNVEELNLEKDESHMDSSNQIDHDSGDKETFQPEETTPPTEVRTDNEDNEQVTSQTQISPDNESGGTTEECENVVPPTVISPVDEDNAMREESANVDNQEDLDENASEKADDGSKNENESPPLAENIRTDSESKDDQLTTSTAEESEPQPMETNNETEAIMNENMEMVTPIGTITSNISAPDNREDTQDSADLSDMQIINTHDAEIEDDKSSNNDTNLLTEEAKKDSTEESGKESMEESMEVDSTVPEDKENDADKTSDHSKHAENKGVTEDGTETKNIKPVNLDEEDTMDTKENKETKQDKKSLDTPAQEKPKVDKEEKKSDKHKQTCVVCRRVGKCKYNIVRNGDVKHLCDDLCFKRFRANPTSFLSKNPADVDSTKASNEQKNCANCKAGLVAGRSMIDGGEHFCSANCIQMKKAALNPGAARRKRRSKSREDPEDDIEILGTSTVPPKQSVRQNVGKRGTNRCSVCNHVKPPKHEVTIGKEVHVLCSDACFAAFRYAKRLGVNNCDFCGKNIKQEAPDVNIQFEGEARRFCNVVCLNGFKTKNQKIAPCTWCQTKKNNFDMVEKKEGTKIQRFCSLNCLSLYRVNLQATSNQRVTCDHCKRFAPAQYHLTMSDASVRNFCSYNCVMGFQAQFQSPQQSPAAGRGAQGAAKGSGAPGSAAPPGAGRGNSPSVPAQTQSRGRGRPSKRGAKVPQVGAAGTGANIPMISQVMSLAEEQGKTPSPTQGRSTSVGTSPARAIAPSSNTIPPPIPSPQQTGPPPPPAQVTVNTHVVVQPPQPKTMRNKSLLCKPIVQTKATSCRPHAVTEGTQTEEDFVSKPALIPVPIPIYVPVPMAMYNIPVPYPVPLPIPIPVPCFVPTTRKSADGILKQIKKIRDTVPDDPFEAELLMMAEAVAGDKNNSSSSEDEDNDAGVMSTDDPQQMDAGGMQQSQEGYGEDMLQMALRMAQEMPDEPAMDLESQLQATPVNPSAPMPQTYNALEQVQMTETPRQRGRGKRRGSSRASKPKKPKIEEPSDPVRPEPINIQPQEPPADANMVLKFTYGVNAWKHWVIGKNQVLEKQYTGKGVTPKLYKADVLACTPDELNFALCQFVKEVRKPNGEEYAPDSIYYLTLGIQEYLFENGRIDNIFTDVYYERFTECLNEVLSHYEVRLNQQGLIVCRIEEEHLWESKQLGAHSPHVLLNTLVYFNTKFFMLRSVEEHLRLSFSHIMKHWKKTGGANVKTQGRSVYLRYYAPTHTEGTRGKRREDQPVFEQAENLDNPLRCPVKLYEFYLSKCPESIKNRNDVFYLVPERSCVPDSPVWYSTMKLGADHMSKMLNRLRVVKEIQEAQLHMQPYGNTY